MLEKEKKELHYQWFEEFNAIKGDLSKLNAWADKTFAPGITFHSPSYGDMNFEQVKQFYTGLVSAFNPIVTVKHIIIEGDMVVAHFNWSGTHQGMFMDIPATGKKVDVGMVLIVKMSGGKSEEVWSYQDAIGLMRQIGAIPGPFLTK